MNQASPPTPAQLAELIEKGDVAAVSAALAADPSLVSSRTADGDTPLHIACWQKQLAIFGTVLSHNPDLDTRGAYGRTALHYAVHEGTAVSPAIVGSLLASGADASIKDDNGFTVEDWAKTEMDEGLAQVLDLLHRRWPAAKP